MLDAKMAARFQRQHCFLCDLPHSPWAVLNDFSEPICRGCCNYEGAERIEDIIQYVRLLRRNWEKAEQAGGGNRVKNVKSDRLNSTGSSVSSTPSPPPSSHVVMNNGGPNFTGSEHKRAVKYQNPQRMSEDSSDASNPNTGGTYAKMSSPEAANGLKGNRPMNVGVRDGERRGSSLSDDPRHGMMNGNTVRNHQVPLMGQPPLGLEMPRQDYLVHETINLLRCSVPFDVRFKKDHNLVGRVCAFDLTTKMGHELELKVLIEYPKGSGSLFQNFARLVKQMHVDASKDYGRGISSGLKYIEYEKDRSKGEWLLLSDLLLETVCLFREPLVQEMLPCRQIEPTDPPLPVVNLAFNPRQGMMVGRKRPRGHDMDEYEVLAAARQSMLARLPVKDDVLPPGWVPNSVEYNKLAVSGAVFPGTPVSSIPSASVPPMVTTPVSKMSGMPLPVSEAHHPSMKSPINAVIPNRLEVCVREDGKQGMHIASSVPSPSRRSPRPPNGPISKSADTQSGPEGEGKERSTGNSILRCSLCRDKLEDTHFVQCPSIGHHKFCFPCSRDSIKKQGAGSEVFCPSGERCPLVGNNLPWAFMKGEIATILGTEFTVKKEKESN